MSIKQRSKSLQSRGEELADTFFQLQVLNGKELSDAHFPSFAERVGALGFQTLKPVQPEILQINVGKLCNQSCSHCHVDAGPDRQEVMTREHLEMCLDILRHTDIPTVDITGGAPELNPHFRWFVESCHQLGKKVINRCNLTIIVSNPRFRDLPDFFAANQVHVISSLPFYSKTRTDSQRGEGVFEDSIAALRLLNEKGYGQAGTGLVLDLVYNPSGAFLPAPQAALEEEFKKQLSHKYGIRFNSLYTITNMPISRFLEYLLESGNYQGYMERLVNAFNPATVNGLMCRNTLSVSWDGYLYDCDFNQMLDLKVNAAKHHISDFDLAALNQRSIVLDQHCYGCTAGTGSSCGGAIT